MDSHRFDQLTRILASGTSRRRMLKGLAGGLFGGAAGLMGRKGTGAADKVFICHNTGSATNPQVLIHVSVNAIPAHEAHGDLIGVDVSSDPFNCGDCGIVCDDENACTENLCVDGECAFPAIVCDDQNACTEDTCDPATGCVFTPIVCDDGDLCTTDSCDPATGCVFTPVNCDDDIACTIDECDPTTGGCVNTPDNSLCDDGDPCTVDRCDPATGCVNAPVVCPEGEICRDGDCVPEECVGGGRCASTADCCEGETCINGICSLPLCEGRDCGNFQACTDNPNCLCFIELGGAGVCADGFQCTCGVTCQVCASTNECPDGFVCVRDSCCAPLQVCVPICTVGATSFAAAARLEGHTPGSHP